MKRSLRLSSAMVLILACAAEISATSPVAASAPLASLPASRATPEPLAADAPGDLESRLVGTWVLVKAAVPGTPSGIGIRQKTFTGGHWEMEQKDPKSGRVVFRHGGSYRLDGDVLTQTVEFANGSTANYVGQTRKFKIKVEGDRYIQEGIGNPFNEEWRRLVTASADTPRSASKIASVADTQLRAVRARSSAEIPVWL